MTKKIILITGANKGIGLQAARALSELGHTLIITARDIEKGKAAVALLAAEGLTVRFEQLDVTNDEMIKHVSNKVTKDFGRLDVLINNAGILNDKTNTLNVTRATVEAHMQTNFYGPLLISQAFYPLLANSAEGRIINVSSQMGRLNGMGGGSAAYRFSKTALNSLTAVMAADLAGTRVKVNCLHPGWVRTDMGGAQATRTLEEGADTIVWLATEPNISTGKFFTNRQEMPW